MENVERFEWERRGNEIVLRLFNIVDEADEYIFTRHDAADLLWGYISLMKD
jgi:hypothetical protein